MTARERLEKAYDWLEEIQNSWSYGLQELSACEAEIKAARRQVAIEEAQRPETDCAE